MKKWSLLLLAVFLMLGACSSGRPKTYQTIGIDEVQQRQDNGAIVLDVREVEEFEEGHIVGAVNLPLSELKQGKDPELNEEETYIVICRSGNRSVEASTILFDAGYIVINVSEGMTSWDGKVE